MSERTALWKPATAYILNYREDFPLWNRTGAKEKRKINETKKKKKKDCKNFILFTSIRERECIIFGGFTLLQVLQKPLSALFICLFGSIPISCALERQWSSWGPA